MNVFALDFDGVLCDSAAETGVTAWRAGRRIWPEWEGAEPAAEHLRRFVELRPVLETGYQAILLMHFAWAGVSRERVRRGFAQMCDQALAEAGVSRAESVRLFGATRDAWIRDDLPDWLSRHRFYPGVFETFAARAGTEPTFILTTKQERFVHALLGSQGVRVPPERVFGLDAGKPKEEVLAELMGRPELQGGRFHFVEDRIGTLLRVAEQPGLEAVRLYLANWGYCTEADLAKAETHPRIAVWPPDRFLAV